MVGSNTKRTEVVSLFNDDLRKLSLGTAIFIISFDLTARYTDPTIKSIITIGKRKVESMKALLLTLVKYSLFIMIKVLFMIKNYTGKLRIPGAEIVSKRTCLRPV
jgi:hypothetical protein